MITEKIVDDETVLEVTTVEEFEKALRRGLPVLASKAIRDAWGAPELSENVGTLEEIIDAGRPGGHR